MIEKALIVIIFMYAASMSMIGGQIVADMMGITIVNYNGVPVTSHIATAINEDELNTRTANIVSANYTGNSTFYDKIETFTTSAAYVAWELITLLTGTYIFNVLLIMGIPNHFVLIFVTLYVLLLARAIIGYIRRI